jgi:hypothetical protein
MDLPVKHLSAAIRVLLGDLGDGIAHTPYKDHRI